MKTQLPAGIAISVLFAVLFGTLGPGSATGQSPSAAAVEPIVLEALQQQADLLKNQAAIEQQVARISEEVRQARIFVARGGGRGGAR